MTSYSALWTLLSYLASQEQGGNLGQGCHRRRSGRRGPYPVPTACPSVRSRFSVACAGRQAHCGQASRLPPGAGTPHVPRCPGVWIPASPVRSAEAQAWPRPWTCRRPWGLAAAVGTEPGLLTAWLGGAHGLSLPKGTLKTRGKCLASLVG